MGNDKNSLAHTTWNCKYRIVFAPKYRRQLLYGELKADIGKILRELCEWKGIKIIEEQLQKIALALTAVAEYQADGAGWPVRPSP